MSQRFRTENKRDSLSSLQSFGNSIPRLACEFVSTSRAAVGRLTRTEVLQATCRISVHLTPHLFLFVEKFLIVYMLIFYSCLLGEFYLHHMLTLQAKVVVESPFSHIFLHYAISPEHSDLRAYSVCTATIDLLNNLTQNSTLPRHRRCARCPQKLCNQIRLHIHVSLRGNG